MSALEWNEHRSEGRVRVARHAPVSRALAPKRWLLGAPLATAQADQELLSKKKALAVLSSDALSSVAYATEESLRVLAVAGAGALAFNVPIAIAILTLLAIVTLSYRQTIFAYPSGGGSYVVASENLGTLAGLVAAAALFIDYVLSVAVSISSGVAALTSAVPSLVPHAIAIGVGFLVVLTVLNLRGVRESATVFAAPTYFFVACVLAMIAAGLVRAFVWHEPPRAPTALVATRALGPLLVLKAFSSGCSAMTGIEAISNDVPVFRAPQSRNAAGTLVWMSVLLAAMFGGITILAGRLGLEARDDETILSQLAHATLGGGALYYAVQASTLLVLVLAANTSYADFPRLASVLARDRFMPSQFAFRGDRLAYSVGIVVLAIVSTALFVGFRGDVSALIPLYAVGVFVAFALSQAGMVRHWFRRRGPGWAASAAINGVGAVAVISGATKFLGGAWVVLVLLAVLVAMFLATRRHYARAVAQLVSETPLDPARIRHVAIVPLSSTSRVALQSLAWARSLTPRVTAVHVADDADQLARFEASWREQAAEHPFLSEVDLVLLESPYRSLVGPLLAFVDDVRARESDATLSVVLPELVPGRWTDVVLHNQSAFRIRAALLFRPGTIVTSVPYHFRSRTKN